jgi:hypothetical protein
VWSAIVQGQALTFHLAGIHDQNFIMRDEETGSFWQQVSGRCIAGPLAGTQLERVHSDELYLSQLAAEAPGATVLVGQPEHADDYVADWEAEIATLPTVVDTSDTPLPPRTLVAGVEVGGHARAYLEDTLRTQPLVLDELGGTPLVLWSEGGRSLRAFDRRLDGATLRLEPAGSGEVIDADTGSRFGFRGCASSGPHEGRCLAPVTVLWDFWFDWHQYHPDTTVYGR